MENVPEHLNAIAMPRLHLNVAEAYLKLGHLDKAYTTAMKSLGFAQRRGRDEFDLRLVKECSSLF